MALNKRMESGRVCRGGCEMGHMTGSEKALGDAGAGNAVLNK